MPNNITRVNWNFLSFEEGEALVETGLGRLSELIRNLLKKGERLVHIGNSWKVHLAYSASLQALHSNT